jgi:hypothetical protein
MAGTKPGHDGNAPASQFAKREPLRLASKRSPDAPEPRQNNPTGKFPLNLSGKSVI